MSQLAFDIEIEPVKPVWFDHMQTMQAGRCSYCLRPLKGRYTRCATTCGPKGWQAECDDCIAARSAARRLFPA